MSVSRLPSHTLTAARVPDDTSLSQPSLPTTPTTVYRQGSTTPRRRAAVAASNFITAIASPHSGASEDSSQVPGSAQPRTLKKAASFNVKRKRSTDESLVTLVSHSSASRPSLVTQGSVGETATSDSTEGNSNARFTRIYGGDMDCPGFDAYDGADAMNSLGNGTGNGNNAGARRESVILAPPMKRMTSMPVRQCCSRGDPVCEGLHDVHKAPC